MQLVGCFSSLRKRRFSNCLCYTAYASVLRPKVCSISSHFKVGFCRFQTCPSKSGNVAVLQESSNSNTSTLGQRKHRITHSQCFPSSDVLKPKPFQVDLLWSLLIEAQCPLWWSARIVGPALRRQLCIECCGICRSKVSVRGSTALLPFKLPSFRFEPCFKLGCDRSNKRNASTLPEPKWCSWLAALHLLKFTQKMKILKLPLLYSLWKCFAIEGVQHFLPFQAGILSVQTCPSKSGIVAVLQESSNSNQHLNIRTAKASDHPQSVLSIKRRAQAKTLSSRFIMILAYWGTVPPLMIGQDCWPSFNKAVVYWVLWQMSK